MPVSIRLCSHNIRYATRSPSTGEEPWDVRRSRIASELRFVTRHCPAAFIGLQEVLHRQLVDVLAALNDETGSVEAEWSSIGVGRDDGERAGEYSPLLYRPAVWRLEESRHIWLSETPDRPSRGWDAACPRILTSGLFQHVESGTWLLAMNTHLDHRGARSRVEAAKLILAEIEQWRRRRESTGPLAVFLTGDFNSERGDEAYRRLNGDDSSIRDFTEWIGAHDRYGNENTFTGFGPDDGPASRIDFLFLGPKQLVGQGHGDDEGRDGRRESHVWRALSYAVLPNRFDDGVYNSDHRAIIGDAQLE